MIERLSEGESLNDICKSEGMPHMATVCRWLSSDEEFREKYARAREIQADRLFEGFGEIEEKVLSGELEPNAARVVLWSRQWRAGKMRPKVYGDKLDVNASVTVGLATELAGLNGLK